MKLSEHKDLKKEILGLPNKEKDKLLLRLVAKDRVLTEHLHFLLLEDESNLNDRIVFIKSEILADVKLLLGSKNANAKDTLSLLRKLMKEINHFYKVTKASIAEIELKLLLFDVAPLKFKFRMHSSSKNYEQLLANYIVKAVLILLRKVEKLHEDLQFDLNGEINSLLVKIYNSYLQPTATELGLPVHVGATK